MTPEEIAAAAGMTVEARHDRSPASLRLGAIGAGALLALAVVAMTVGLVRSEAAGDLRTLTASGATRRHAPRPHGLDRGHARPARCRPRRCSARTWRWRRATPASCGVLGDVPVVELVVLAAGVPLLAAGAGWALGGREPTSLVRLET